MNYLNSYLISIYLLKWCEQIFAPPYSSYLFIPNKSIVRICLHTFTKAAATSHPKFGSDVSLIHFPRLYRHGIICSYNNLILLFIYADNQIGNAHVPLCDNAKKKNWSDYLTSCGDCVVRAYATWRFVKQQDKQWISSTF